MGIHKHDASTKSDRLIEDMEALTQQIVTLQSAMASLQGLVSDLERQVSLFTSPKMCGGDMPFGMA